MAFLPHHILACGYLPAEPSSLTPQSSGHPNVPSHPQVHLLSSSPGDFTQAVSLPRTSPTPLPSLPNPQPQDLSSPVLCEIRGGGRKVLTLSRTPHPGQRPPPCPQTLPSVSLGALHILEQVQTCHGPAWSWHQRAQRECLNG